MKKTLKTYAGAAAILLAGATLASCAGTDSSVPPTEADGTVDLSIALNDLNEELVASSSASNVSIDLTADDIGIYYNHTETKDYVAEDAVDETTNPFSINAYLHTGNLSIDAGGLDQENPGTNVKAAIEGGFEEMALTVHNTNYVNVDADFTLTGIDMALYVDAGNLYADLTDPEMAELLKGLNLNSGTTILAENLFGSRTKPLISNPIADAISNWLGDFTGVIDALKDFITAKFIDDSYVLTVDMAFADLVNTWVADYKWRNPSEAEGKTDEELVALGEEHYSYLDAEAFKVYLNINFDGLSLKDFETDINVTYKSEEVLETVEGEYTTTSNKTTSLILKSAGTFAYDVADGVKLPDFSNYTK